MASRGDQMEGLTQYHDLQRLPPEGQLQGLESRLDPTAARQREQTEGDMSLVKEIHPWHKDYPNGQNNLIDRPDLEQKLDVALPELKKLVRPGNLWAYLKKYGVMDGSEIDKCKAAGVKGAQVEAIVDFLKQDVVWKLHAFFRSLAQIGQTRAIDEVLGRGAKEAYNKNLLETDQQAPMTAQPIPIQTRDNRISGISQLLEGQHLNVHQEDSQAYNKQENRRKRQLKFSREFTPTGGILHNPDTDVVLTVPTGAVPQGEAVEVCVTIHTDLENYDKWIKPGQFILGPVVECKMDRAMAFCKPVTLSIPLCISPKKSSDVTVLYSNEDTFTSISEHDDMCYRTEGSTLNIDTHHFTKFMAAGEIVTIDNVLLTLAAKLTNGPKSSNLELRPTAFVNCLKLKEFEDERNLVKQTIYSNNMDEIARTPVTLREGHGVLQYPNIVMKVKLEEGSPWKIIDDENDDAQTSYLEKMIDGIDVLKVSDCHWKPMPAFHLKSLNKDTPAECTMKIIFDYKEDDIKPAVHTFIVNMADFSPCGMKRHGSTEPNESQGAKRLRHTTTHGSQGTEATAAHRLTSNLTGSVFAGNQPGDYEWIYKGFDKLRDSLDAKEPKPQTVGIALLDSGIDTGHPELKDTIPVTSQNFVEGELGDLEKDTFGHGTFCLGIILQRAGKHVKILNAKVGNTSDVLRALKHIDENPQLGIDIIHMALDIGQDQEVKDMLYKLAKEKVIIAAAGNYGQQRLDTVANPASQQSVIAVGACDDMGNRARFSAVGRGLDCLFPGENILSYRSTNKIQVPGAEVDLWEVDSGTSFATPHCAALVALILASVETWFPDGKRLRKLLTTSENMWELLKRFCTRRKDERGYGIPDLEEVTEDIINHHFKKV